MNAFIEKKYVFLLNVRKTHFVGVWSQKITHVSGIWLQYIPAHRNICVDSE